MKIELIKKPHQTTQVQELSSGDYFTTKNGDSEIKKVIEVLGNNELYYNYVNTTSNTENSPIAYPLLKNFHSTKEVTLYKPISAEFIEL